MTARSRLVRVGVGATAIGVCVTGLVACSSGKGGAAGSTSATGSSSAAGDPHTVAISITPAGCAPTKTTYTSGPLTFNITNKNATAVSEVELLSGERIVGEKENLPPGFSGSFALSLESGRLHALLPGRDHREDDAEGHR